MPSHCATPAVTTQFSSRAATLPTTSTAMLAIPSWPRNHWLDAARVADSNVSASVIQQRQRERFQIEQGDPLGVFGVEAVALDAVRTELTPASAQLAFTETGEWRAPIAMVPQRTWVLAAAKGSESVIESLRLSGVPARLYVAGIFSKCPQSRTERPGVQN
jgi:hypothetical protein